MSQLSEAAAVGKFHFFFAKVEFEFDERHEVEELGSQRSEFARESAAHLVDGNSVSCSRR